MANIFPASEQVLLRISKQLEQMHERSTMHFTLLEKQFGRSEQREERAELRGDRITDTLDILESHVGEIGKQLARMARTLAEASEASRRVAELYETRLRRLEGKPRLQPEPEDSDRRVSRIDRRRQEPETED